MKRLIIFFGICALFFGGARGVLAACPTAIPSNACTEDDFSAGFDAVYMCFNSVSFIPSTATDMTDSSTWSTLFTATDGVEFNIMDLGDGVGLGDQAGVTMGSLAQNTSYPCAVANVTSIILDSSTGDACDATALLEQALGTGALARMYIRGTSSCPGDDTFPTGLPIATGASATSCGFKFNVQMGQQAPQFIFKPTDSSCTLDSSNITEVTLTCSGAADTGSIFGAAFKNTTLDQGPDSAGGQGSVSSGTASVTLSLPNGTYNAIALFQDVDSSGADNGPVAGTDTICSNDDGFTASGTALTLDGGAMAVMPESGGGGGGGGTDLSSIVGVYTGGTVTGGCEAVTTYDVSVSGTTVTLLVDMTGMFTGTGSLTADFTVTGQQGDMTIDGVELAAGVFEATMGVCVWDNYTK